MFQIQQFINHKYVTVDRKRSLSGAGLAAQKACVNDGAFRILSPRGKIVRRGRVTKGQIRWAK